MISCLCMFFFSFLSLPQPWVSRRVMTLSQPHFCVIYLCLILTYLSLSQILFLKDDSIKEIHIDVLFSRTYLSSGICVIKNLFSIPSCPSVYFLVSFPLFLLFSTFDTFPFPQLIFFLNYSNSLSSLFCLLEFW